MKKALAVLMVVAASVSHGAIITFDFTGTNPGQNAPWAPTTIDPNATSSGFNLGAGVTGNSANNRFNAKDWSGGTTLASALAGNDYIGFVLTPNGGYQANLNGAALAFTLQTSWDGSSGNGPKNYALFSSIDGFAEANVLQQGTVVNSQNFSYTFTGAGYDGLTGPIEFRFYGWNAAGANGTMSADNVSLGGSVVIPEPAEWGLYSAIGLLAIGGYRLRKAKILKC